MKKLFLLIAAILFSLFSCKQEKLHVQVEHLLKSPEEWEIQSFYGIEGTYILIKNEKLYDLKNTIIVHDINERFMPRWYEKSQYAKKEFTKKEEEIIARVTKNKLSKTELIKTFLQLPKRYQGETSIYNGIMWEFEDEIEANYNGIIWESKEIEPN